MAPVFLSLAEVLDIHQDQVEFVSGWVFSASAIIQFKKPPFGQNLIRNGYFHFISNFEF